MDSRILYIENPNDAIKRLLEIINIVKFQDAKSIYKNLLYFCILAERKIKTTQLQSQ